MNKSLLQPLQEVVLKNNAIDGTNIALLHIVHQNNLAELDPSLVKYLQSNDLFFELKDDEILSHAPKEFSLLGQEKYLTPVIKFAAGRAYNDSVSRIQKEYGITGSTELNKLKSIISDLYAEACKDTPDLQRIKALSSTLLSSMSKGNKFMLTSGDPEMVLHKLHDNISSQIHHVISQEIKDTSNIKDITFHGNEVLWRGITLPSTLDIEKFLSTTHINPPSLYKFQLPLSDDAPDFGHRVCTSAGLSIPMSFGIPSPEDSTVGYLLEIRPKSCQKATFLADHHLCWGLKELELDFDKIDTHEVYAAYKLHYSKEDGYSSAYTIEQVNLNQYYTAREADAKPDAHLHFAKGDKFSLQDPTTLHVPTVDQLETGKLTAAQGNTVTNYSFVTTPNYKMFEPVFKKFGGSALKEDGDLDNYTPPKIDLSKAEANRMETKEHDAKLYSLEWPYNCELVSQDLEV